MKTVIKAVLVTLAIFACSLGMSYVGDMLQKLTGGLSHWLILGGLLVFVFWSCYRAFKELDLAVTETEAEGFELIVGEIVRERYRQLERGYDAEHDATNDQGQIALAAACYAWNARGRGETERVAPFLWPWPREEWKPATPRRDLVKAAALILAEIERLDRVPRNLP